MNKKIIMTSMVAVFVGWGAYANTVDIDANGNRLNSNPAVAANCTEPILGTYSGSTDFEAKWQANSIPLRWYSDDEQLQVQGEAGTCTYDSGLTVPSSQYQPTKRGYHFRGWTIKTTSDNCEITAEILDALETSGGAEIIGTIDAGGDANNADAYGLTDRNTWALRYSDGTIIKGMASCNGTTEGGNTSGMSTTDTGQYCWCKVTSYTPNSGEACDVAETTAWVFSGSSGLTCSTMCVLNCSLVQTRDLAFRRALFGITQ